MTFLLRGVALLFLFFRFEMACVNKKIPFFFCFLWKFSHCDRWGKFDWQKKWELKKEEEETVKFDSNRVVTETEDLEKLDQKKTFFFLKKMIK